MSHSRFISSTPLIAGLLTSLLFAILVVSLNAADSDSWYDVSKEVTVSGTVSRVLHKPAPGMIWGSHLMVETTSGRLDASLGRFGLEGEGALSVIPGQQIELTGVMKTVRDKEVFVVRSVKANGKTFTVRNEHGICSISSRNRSRFVFRPYFSNPVCTAKACCRIRLLTSTYTLPASPVDRRVLQRFLSSRDSAEHDSLLRPKNELSSCSLFSASSLRRFRLSAQESGPSLFRRRSAT